MEIRSFDRNEQLASQRHDGQKIAKCGILKARK